MNRIPLSSIILHRADRQRREIDNVTDLMESIRQWGVIQPIILTEDNILVAGERRFTACIKLGLLDIPFVRQNDRDEAELKIIEMEENIRRKDLPWRDRVRAVMDYHTKAEELYPKWSGPKTAATLSMDYSIFGDHRKVWEELEAGNELVNYASTFTAALNICERAISRRQAALEERSRHEVNKLFADPSADDAAYLDLEHIEGQAVEEIEDFIPLHNISFHDFVPAFSGLPFNFLHCDFPYGINADKHTQGAANSFGGYEDSEDVYWSLLSTLGDFTSRGGVAEQAHLMFWFSMDYYSDTVAMLQTQGWRINPFPLIWHKSDNSGILPDSARGPRRLYETALMGSRGDRKIVRATGNIVAHANTKLVHPNEKPKRMLHHFMAMFVDEYTTMLDPTCGSGNAVKVAEELGAERVLGLEQDPIFYQDAQRTYRTKDE